MAQLYKDPSADGHFTAWTGTFADWDDGATADDDTTYQSNSANNARDSSYVPNVSSAEIPDGSTINWVQIESRVRAETGSRTFVHGVYKGTGGADINEDATGDTATTTYAEFTHQMTTDPFTGVAWAISTLRDWTSGGGVPRSFGLKKTVSQSTLRCTRLRVLIDYTEGSGGPAAGLRTLTVTGAGI